MKRLCLHLGLVFALVILPAMAFADTLSIFGILEGVVQWLDPANPDSVYLVCQPQTDSQQVIQVRLKTNNIYEGDSVVAFHVPLWITTDKPGVTLDTTVKATYKGTAVSTWEYLPISVRTNSENPSLFPMLIVVGAWTMDPSGVLLGAGDHLLANLTFKISKITRICVDSTHQNLDGHEYGLELVTESAHGFTPRWRSKVCCRPSYSLAKPLVLMVFVGIPLLGFIVYYLRRAKHRPAYRP